MISQLNLVNTVFLFISVTTLLFNLFNPTSSFFTLYYEIHKWGESSPILATLYFYWLDLTLLPVLFITVSLLLVWSRNWLREDLKSVFAVALLLNFLTNSTDLYFLNGNLLTASTHYHNVNAFLLNSLNRYHPLIFYVSALLMLTMLANFFIGTSREENFVSQATVSTLFTYRIPILTANGLALFLGSWWALQEWSWGGWWNWDPSETFGLGVAFFILLHTHTSLHYGDYAQYKTKAVLLTLLFVVSYFVIQLNFEILSHNFGLDSFIFFNKNAHLVYVALFLLVLYRKYKVDVYKTSILTWPHVQSFLPALLVLTLVATPLVISYWPIVTFLLWKFLTFNGTTTAVVPPVVFVGTLYLLKESIFRKTELSYYRLYGPAWLVSEPLNLTLIHTLQKPLALVYTSTHVWILITILLTSNVVGQDFFSWSYAEKPSRLLTGNVYLSTPEWFTTYNSHLVDNLLLWRDANHGFFYRQISLVEGKTNTVDFNPLVSTEGLMFNFVPNHLSRYPATLTTQLHNLTPLAFYSFLTWLLLVVFLRIKSRKSSYTNF